MNKSYIDFKAIEKVPNKYNLRPADIKKLRVLDWDKLKKICWHNEAMKNGDWWCHLEGSQAPGEKYNDEDEFWIGFDAKNDRINYWFDSYEGMCRYNFTTFYSSKDIENKYDMNVQLNAMRFLNKLLDEKIVELG